MKCFHGTSFFFGSFFSLIFFFISFSFSYPFLILFIFLILFFSLSTMVPISYIMRKENLLWKVNFSRAFCLWFLSNAIKYMKKSVKLCWIQETLPNMYSLFFAKSNAYSYLLATKFWLNFAAFFLQALQDLPKRINIFVCSKQFLVCFPKI